MPAINLLSEISGVISLGNPILTWTNSNFLPNLPEAYGIDNNSYELTVDNKVSISEIINSFNNNKINVIEILSKRNKLEELFMELTQEW